MAHSTRISMLKTKCHIYWKQFDCNAISANRDHLNIRNLPYFFPKNENKLFFNKETDHHLLKEQYSFPITLNPASPIHRAVLELPIPLAIPPLHTLPKQKPCETNTWLTAKSSISLVTMGACWMSNRGFDRTPPFPIALLPLPSLSIFSVFTMRIRFGGGCCN